MKTLKKSNIGQLHILQQTHIYYTTILIHSKINLNKHCRNGMEWNSRNTVEGKLELMAAEKRQHPKPKPSTSPEEIKEKFK